MRKKVLLLLSTLSILIVALFTGCESNTPPTISDIDSGAKSDQDNSSNTDIDSDAPKTEEDTSANLPNHATIGQVVTGDTWSIGLIYAKEFNTIESDFISDTPSDGNVFVSLFFDVKNISSSDDYFNNLYFEGYVDDYSTSSAIVFNDPDGYSMITGTVDAGKMIKGSLVYEVPADWNELEVYYKDGIWTTHKAAKFVITKDDLVDDSYAYESSIFDKYTFDVSNLMPTGTTMESSDWAITYLEAEKYDKVGSDFFVTEASEGKEFVVFFLEAQNTSDEDDYFNYLYFRFYVDGYYSTSSSILDDIDNYSMISGDVAAGKKIKGYIAIEVPKTWEFIELIYDDGTFTSNKVIEIAIQNN